MCSVLLLYMRQESLPGCRLKAHCAPRCPHSIARSPSGRAFTPAGMSWAVSLALELSGAMLVML